MEIDTIGAIEIKTSTQQKTDLLRSKKTLNPSRPQTGDWELQGLSSGT